MTFENLNLQPKCNCLEGAHTDQENSYYRKLKRENATIEDFKTHFERGIGTDELDCDLLCSYKGISINLRKSEYEELILNKYRTTFSFNPKKGAYCLIFQLKEDAGMVKSAPEEDDESHFNFFKSDAFTIDRIEIIETIKFA